MRITCFSLFFLLHNFAYAQHDSLTNNILTTQKYRYGIYEKFQEFKLNTPSITDGFIIKIDSGKYLRYTLEDLKGRKFRNVYGFSDGKSLFINAAVYGQSNYFVPFLMLGPILYFEDNVARSFVNAGRVGIMFGVAGFGLTYLLSESNKNQNPGWITFFPDNDGNAYLLSRKTIKSILKEYDYELWQRYKVEHNKNSYKTLIKYLIEFNKRNKSLNQTNN